MLISAAHAISSHIHLLPVVIPDYTLLEPITAVPEGGQAVPPLCMSLGQASDHRCNVLG